jgi:hypothetical protein
MAKLPVWTSTVAQCFNEFLFSRGDCVFLGVRRSLNSTKDKTMGEIRDLKDLQAALKTIDQKLANSRSASKFGFPMFDGINRSVLDGMCWPSRSLELKGNLLPIDTHGIYATARSMTIGVSPFERST